MGERTSTTTMGDHRRSRMERRQSMGERPTTDHRDAKKVNQHG
jgi:hypothetical protein